MTSHLHYLGPRRTPIHISPPRETKGDADRSLALGKDARLTRNEIIDAALKHYLNMDAETRQAVIEDINTHGRFRVFGYGSLIRDPAYDLDIQYPGHVDGWECGALCKDRYMRGIPGNLGITMGAEPTEGARLRGMVQEIRIDRPSGSSDLNRILEAIRDFARRETSLNPIYRYEMVDVVTEGKGTVRALICRADERSALFLGRDRPAPGADGRLTLLEKAAVITGARGVPGASGRETGLDYWRFVLHCRYRAGIPPEPHIQKLVETANAMRALLPPKERRELEIIEGRGVRLGKKEPLDPRALRCDPRVLAHFSERDVAELRETARKKLGLLEPLSTEKLAKTHALFRELQLPSDTPSTHVSNDNLPFGTQVASKPTLDQAARPSRIRDVVRSWLFGNTQKLG